MKIALVTHVVRREDGQGRVNYEITKKLSEAGHEVTLVASEVAPDLLAMPTIRWANIKVGTLPTRFLKYQIFALKSAAWLYRHRDTFDVVHVNGGITYAASDINSVHFVHSGWRKSAHYVVQPGARGYYHRFFTNVNAIWEKNAFLQSRQVIAVSRQIEQEVCALSISKSKVKVITNGVDIHEFCPGIESRRQLGLPDDVFLAFFAGDIKTSRKNLGTVMQALALSPQTHLAVAGRIAGSPFPKLAQELGIAARVHFLDFRSDIAALMRACDVFVFPSRYEACSLVLLEALASGLPIITAETVGGSEIMNLECGFIVTNPDDITSIAQALAALQSDATLRASMSAAAREVACRYTWDSMANQYLDAYQKLSNQG